MDDTELINLLCSRDEHGMEQFIKQYGKLVRYVIHGVLRNARDEEECFNEICILLWEKSASFDESKGKFSTWITVIARNTALSMRKKIMHHESEKAYEAEKGQNEMESPEDLILRNEKAERLKSAINRLDNDEKNLFFRKYYYMQPIKQIATESGMTERSVEGKLYRLRKRLQKELGGDYQ